MPLVFRNLSLSSALWKCYRVWTLSPEGLSCDPEEKVDPHLRTSLIHWPHFPAPWVSLFHYTGWKVKGIWKTTSFHIAGCLLSTALGVWSWSYFKQRRSGPNRRQDPEEMDAFLVHLPHVSIKFFPKRSDSWHRPFNSIDRSRGGGITRVNFLNQREKLWQQ